MPNDVNEELRRERVRRTEVQERLVHLDALLALQKLGYRRWERMVQLTRREFEEEENG